MKQELWARLIKRKSLRDVAADTINGRVDLRSVHVPDPYVRNTVKTKIADIELLGGLAEIKGATWEGIDFSGSNLPALRFFDCKIVDCLFDDCRCREWSAWGTSFSSVSFRSANLRDALLGGVNHDRRVAHSFFGRGDRRSTFHSVDFTLAEMRGTIYEAAEFVSCTFKNARLNKVRFNSSTLTDCVFEGELRQVEFSKWGFEGENFPPNEMVNVDFSRARLRWTEFRNLNLDRVRFPEDDEHIVIRDFPETLVRLIAFFENHNDDASKGYVGLFEHVYKWKGANQRVGVLNKMDLREIGGDEGLETVARVIAVESGGS